MNRIHKNARHKTGLTLALIAVLSQPLMVSASPYTYEIQQNWSSASDAGVFGTTAYVDITVDNGGSSNASQSYTWSDITGMSLHTNGTFAATWINHYTGGTGAASDVLFSTDLTGINALFNIGSSANDHYYNTNSNPGYYMQFAAGSGHTALYVNPDSQNYSLYAYLHPWNDQVNGTLITGQHEVPEPGTIALLGLGLLGVAGLRKKAA